MINSTISMFLGWCYVHTSKSYAQKYLYKKSVLSLVIIGIFFTTFAITSKLQSSISHPQALYNALGHRCSSPVCLGIHYVDKKLSPKLGFLKNTSLIFPYSGLKPLNTFPEAFGYIPTISDDRFQSLYPFSLSRTYTKSHSNNQLKTTYPSFRKPLHKFFGFSNTEPTQTFLCSSTHPSSFLSSGSTFDSNRNYYEIFDIPQDSSHDEIESQYRNLTNSLLGVDDRLLIAELEEAYRVLSDPRLRKKYDEILLRFQGRHNDNMGEASHLEGRLPEEVTDIKSTEDIDADAKLPKKMPSYTHMPIQTPNLFQKLLDPFSWNRAKKKEKESLDIPIVLPIDLETAILGGKRTLSHNRKEVCTTCTGYGTSTIPQTCPICHGKGMITQTQRSRFGFISTSSSCEKCGGTGRLEGDVCKACSGEGYPEMAVSSEVTIPSLSNDGDILYVQGRGNESPHSKGDLKIILKVQEDPKFSKMGDKILTNIQLNYLEAIFGAKKIITIFGHQISFNVPAGSQPDDEIFIKRNESKFVCDIVLKLKVKLPTHNSDYDEMALLKKIQELHTHT